jgi:hypothetical protein
VFYPTQVPNELYPALVVASVALHRKQEHFNSCTTSKGFLAVGLTLLIELEEIELEDEISY